MPYSKAHKQNSRERILTSAVELFSRLGFDNVTIDDLMQHAKLTRGAFYAHFDSKSDVYKHAISSAAANAFAVRSQDLALQGREWLERFISVYLSEEHIEQRNSPCPLAFMVTDVANNDPKVKSAYTKVFAGFANLISEHMAQHNQAETSQFTQALAVSAMLIGSVAIGRALEDKELRLELLKSSAEIAAQVLSLENAKML